MPQQFNEEDRQLFRAAARAVDDAQLAASSSAHNFRNALAVAIVLLAGAAILFPIVAGRSEAQIADLNTGSTPTATQSSLLSPTPSAAPSVAPTSATSRPASAVPSSASPGPATTAAPGVPSPFSPATPAGANAENELPSTGRESNVGKLAAIELWGVLGALVGAVAGLRNLRGVTQPIGLQLAQIALKIPTGALTALTGVVLLQAALTPSTQPVPTGKLAAFAIIFGLAQEALTGFVDRTAGQLLDKGKTLGEKTTQGG
jgi:hypothetical protein